ncbi:MAG: hypothetical protein A2Y34_05285 [Spirochaetes bacterium GWC1_27_15]|nr:MAG: hypothetical protein A2Z98_00810 [Spirochaetes bacterium GWB1_27_13]OHD05915.1 MAG: hypothetical protein A2Z98_00820 [Spirochaetes bacterium GWB1_27_13]OHD22441.1 MAG: hypothetical protein A2Y34_05285 [Spirochaetes bacterium GWC1_27_15]
MSLFKINFTQIGTKDKFRPYIEFIIKNTETDKKINAMALIDTGADECALPGFYATILGHNLENGFKKDVKVAGGNTVAFRHTNKLIIPKINFIKNMIIDFIPNLHIPIIGVNLIENFNVFLYYPKKYFIIDDLK